MKNKSQKNPPPAPVPPLPVWQPIAAVVGCLWTLFVLIKYDQKFPNRLTAPLDLMGDFLDQSPIKTLMVMPGYLKSLLVTAVLVVSAACWGNLILPKLEEAAVTLRERMAIALGLGFVFLSTLVFFLGLAGGYQKETLLGFLLITAGLGLFLNRRAGPAVWTEMKSFSWISPFRTPAHILLTLLVFLSFLMAFVPELFYDSLVYHVGLPQMFVNEGRVVDTPHVYFSRFPLLVHMLYVIGVGLDGSTAAKLINWTHFVMGLGAVYLILKRLGYEKGAVWACLFLAAMPVIQLNVWSTAIDTAQSSYAALALLAYLLWRSGQFQSNRWLTILGLFAGAAFAVKYTGVVVGMAFGLMVLFGRKPNSNPILGGLSNGALFSLMIFLVMSPYLVRNFIWTGNPTYPIMANHLESRNLNKEQVASEEELVARNKPKDLKAWVNFPWNLTMLEQTSFNFIGPMMLAGLPFLVFLPWKKSLAIRPLAAVTAIYFIVALQFSGDIRYLLPGFFLLSVLLGAGLAEAKRLPVFLNAAVKCAVFMAAFCHLAMITSMMRSLYNPARVLTGAEDREQFASTMHNGLNLWPWHPMMATLRALPEPCRVYIMGTEQVFGFPRRFWYSSVHDYTPLVLWANESKDGDELYQKIKAEGLTHFLVDVPEAIRLRGYRLWHWNDQGRKSFSDFSNKYLKLADVKPIMQYENSLFLFAVKEPGDATPLPFQMEKFFKEVLNLGAPA